MSCEKQESIKIKLIRAKGVAMSLIEKKTEHRYRMRHMYGRYEVVDGLSDRPICYGFNSEEVENIVLAMNMQYEKDINEDQVAGELGG